MGKIEASNYYWYVRRKNGNWFVESGVEADYRPQPGETKHLKITEYRILRETDLPPGIADWVAPFVVASGVRAPAGVPSEVKITCGKTGQRAKAGEVCP